MVGQPNLVQLFLFFLVQYMYIIYIYNIYIIYIHKIFSIFWIFKNDFLKNKYLKLVDLGSSLVA